LSIKNKHARVVFGKEKRKVKLGITKPKVGDYVLVISGIVTDVISEEDARKILEK